MTEETPQATEPKVDEAPKQDAPKQEAPKKDNKLDSTKPLSQQVDKILSNLPKEEDKKDDNANPEADSATKEPEAGEAEGKDSPDEGAGEKEPETQKDDTPDAIGNLDEVPYEQPKELPPVSKYILDNLPEITTIGHQADGAEKVFKVKRVEDLPPDFEFASRRDELVFNAAIASQELNARQLLQKYEAEEAQNKYQEYMNQQALEVQADIKQLQKEGLLDEFKYANDDPKFNDDPAVKEANAIYKIFEDTNNAYIKQGKAYRISYRDAADKYYAAKARTAPAKDTKQPTPTPNKAERDSVANKVSAPQGSDANKGKIPVRRGMNMQDINRLVNQGRI